MTERSEVDASEGAGASRDESSDSGEATKPASAILRQEISIGTEQLDRSASGLFLSAVSAGLDIGFGPFMVVTVMALAPTETLATTVVTAFVYAIGFVIVILGRSELFTEHTTLAVLPVLSTRATIGRLARLWTLVYAGNMVGVVAFSAGAVPLGIGLGLFSEVHAGRLAEHLLGVGWWVMFGSAVAAGWMMGLVSWLVTAARDTVGQLVVILLITGSIALLGLHHSIAGSVEVLLGVFSAAVPFGTGSGSSARRHLETPWAAWCSWHSSNTATSLAPAPPTRVLPVPRQRPTANGALDGDRMSILRRHR